MKAPDWTREELILALDLYFELDIAWLRKLTGNSPQMVALSKTLREIPIHSPEYKQSDSFRSPSSVHMKLMNFLRCDPRYGKAGLPNGSRLEQSIWDEFKDNKEKLKLEAEAVIKQYLKLSANSEVDESKINGTNEDILLENFVDKINQALNEVEKLLLEYSENRKNAAFVEPLEESQKMINEMYQKILNVNEWKTRLEEIKKGIQASKSQKSSEFDIKLESLSNPGSNLTETQNKNLVKFPNKYRGIALKRDTLLFILQTIKEIDAKEVYIETNKILKKVSSRVQKESSCVNRNTSLLMVYRAIISECNQYYAGNY